VLTLQAGSLLLSEVIDSLTMTALNRTA